MRRNVLFVLLLAAGVVSAEAQVKTEVPQAQTEAVQEQNKEALEQTEAAQELSEETQEQTEKDAKVISGMSILGNQEAPKSLVLVPWKGSEIGKPMDISTMFDDSRQPVDREMFMRALRYYEIRSETKP